MSVLRKTFRIDDVLTDMTSVLLSDVTGAFGVKRNDTDAVVVPDGTPMVRESIGVYSYEFLDPAYGLTYTYSLEFTYQGETHHLENEFRGPVLEAPSAPATLDITYPSLLAEVARYLGYPGDTTLLTGEQLRECDACVQTGYRRFVYPDLVLGEKNQHLWSFLTPTMSLELWPAVSVDADVTVSAAYSAATGLTTITATEDSFYRTMLGKAITVIDVGGVTISGYVSATVVTATGDVAWDGPKTFRIASNGDYRLPDDFGGQMGTITFDNTDRGGMLAEIAIRAESYVRTMRLRSDRMGHPVYGAIRPVILDQTVGQRFELCVWPTPTTLCRVWAPYLVQYRNLTHQTPYPLGGQAHADTIMELCLAAAELWRNGEPGPHTMMGMRRLAASVSFDRQATAPGNLGDGFHTMPFRRTLSVKYEPDD